MENRQFIKEPNFTDLVLKFETLMDEYQLRALEKEILVLILSDRMMTRKHLLNQEASLKTGVAGEIINKAKKLLGGE